MIKPHEIRNTTITDEELHNSISLEDGLRDSHEQLLNPLVIKNYPSVGRTYFKGSQLEGRKISRFLISL